jgi:hypothetical protein
MGMLDGSGLSPVPADQVEAAAAFRIGAVGDDIGRTSPAPCNASRVTV